jgi:hypothetical protein
MHLQKFIHTNTGKYIMSFILGFGLASLFRVACKGTDCRYEIAPPLENIDGQIYKFDNQCYKMEKTAVKCTPLKKKMLETA